MATRDLVYNVDDVWQLASAMKNETKRYTLIDGELTVSIHPDDWRGRTTTEIARLMGNYVAERELGDVRVESGHYPPQDHRNPLLPDVAFISKARASLSGREGFVTYMPDLAVEIISPWELLAHERLKANVYLRHGTACVWLIQPNEKSAEMWTTGNDNLPQSETINVDGALSGGPALPGFTLPLRRLFH